MSIRSKTKPLTIVSSIEELWDALAMNEENTKLIEREVLELRAELRLLKSFILEQNEGMETKRLD